MISKPSTALATTAFIAVCGPIFADQPALEVRIKDLVEHDNLAFRDLNGNGQLDTYEDWRLDAKARSTDLVSQMTLPEKAGAMMIDTLLAGCNGAVEDVASALVTGQHMTHFILRNPVEATAGSCEGRPPFSGRAITAEQFAGFTNGIQELAEASRLGIPVLFKSNARNHLDIDPRFGISEGSGAMSQFPKEPGIAAAVLGQGNTAPVDALTDVMGAEWRALGLRGMYGYMADLATEPRWYRAGETFGEDSALTSRIITSLITGLQGETVSADTAVALTIKHFPGGGPQLDGLDPHYSFGKEQAYPGNAFDLHLAPFRAAIAAGVGAIMPYYGLARDLEHAGTEIEPVGMSFSRQMIDGILRGELGFEGYVNSDTGIVKERAWGMENATVPERLAASINAGVDILSGFHDAAEIVALVESGAISEDRLDTAVARILTEQFELGLFENPYVDVADVDVVGSAANLDRAFEVQRQSVVLLENRNGLLPLQGKSLYVIGGSPAIYAVEGVAITDGNAEVRPTAEGHDAAIVRISVSNTRTNAYRTNDPAFGANTDHLNPRTGEVWGAQDPCNMAPDVNRSCVDDMNIAPGVALGMVFGGAFPWETNNLSFSTMAKSASWEISPSLETIQAIMSEVGAEKTVLVINFRNPYVLDAESGLQNAGALLAEWGVSDLALRDVLDGTFEPSGKMPFALANNLDAVIANAPDLQGYDAADTLYPFASGRGY